VNEPRGARERHIACRESDLVTAKSSRNRVRLEMPTGGRGCVWLAVLVY